MTRAIPVDASLLSRQGASGWRARKSSGSISNKTADYASLIPANQMLSHALPFWAVRPYLALMTKLLEKALEAVRRLPPDSQDEIALAC
jgi:hypothetical protein